MNKFIIANGTPKVSSSRRVVIGPVGSDDSKPLYTQSDINFQVSNVMKDPLEMIRGVIKTFKKASLALKVVGFAGDTVGSAVSHKNTRFMSPYNNTKVWVSTNPLKFSIDLDFNLGMWGMWDAQKEVVEPIQQLSKFVVPEIEKNGFQVTGPGPSMVDMLVAVVKGSQLTEVVQHPVKETKALITDKNRLSGFMKNFSGSITDFFDNQENITKISILNGGIVLDSYIDNCTYSYGDIVDDNGNPVSGKIRLSCSTYKMANTSYVFRGFDESGRLQEGATI